MVKTINEIVNMHHKVECYVGEPTKVARPQLTTMWATLFNDGQFYIHEGQDPLEHADTSGYKPKTFALSDLANITRYNNSKECKLKAYLNFGDLFAGLSVQSISDDELQLNVHAVDREMALKKVDEKAVSNLTTVK